MTGIVNSTGARSGVIGTITSTPTSPVSTDKLIKAWISFNGTGTIAIRDSFNVSSITDNAVGNYYVDLTTAMSDTNYTLLTHNNAYGGGWSNAISSSRLQVYSRNYEGAAMVDAGYFWVTLHG